MHVPNRRLMTQCLTCVIIIFSILRMIRILRMVDAIDVYLWVCCDLGSRSWTVRPFKMIDSSPVRASPEQMRMTHVMVVAVGEQT